MIYLGLFVLAIVVLTYLNKRKPKERAMAIEERLDHISVHGLVPFEVEAINPLPGEMGLMQHSDAQMYGFKTIKGIESIIPVSKGDLYLTTERVIFTGDLRSVNINLKDVVGINFKGGRVIINTKNKVKPFIFYHYYSEEFAYSLKLKVNNALILSEEEF